MRHINLDRLTEILLDSIFKGKSIQEMIHSAFSYIGLPMNYFDTSFHLVANALPNEKPFYFEPWEEMDQLGYAPDTTISRGNYLYYQEKMYRQKQSMIFDDGTSENYPQACGPVMLEDELIGYMGTMVEDVYPEEVIAANDLLISTIKVIHYKEHQRQLNFDKMFTPQSILLGKEITDYYAETFAEKFPPPYVYAVMCSKIMSVTSLHYVKYYLSNRELPVIAEIENENYLYFLIYNAHEIDRILPEIEQIVHRYSMMLGVSDRFFSPQAIRDHRTQAMLSLSLVNQETSDERIYHFTDMFSEVVASAILEKNSIESLIQSELKTLIQLDKTEGTNYLETLTAYLDSGLKSSVAAEKLGLHNNSVMRRLDRIQEICGFDLRESGCMNRLSLQLDLIRYWGRMGHVL